MRALATPQRGVPDRAAAEQKTPPQDKGGEKKRKGFSLAAERWQVTHGPIADGVGSH